jgi:hypothetical protein
MPPVVRYDTFVGDSRVVDNRVDRIEFTRERLAYHDYLTGVERIIDYQSALWESIRPNRAKEPYNIELSSAADYNQKPKFLTDQHSL